MLSPISTLPSLQNVQALSEVQAPPLTRRIFTGLAGKISWLKDFKGNILVALAIYNLVYGLFLFVSGYWLTASIALFTAGFCSATRKDIRDFTNLSKHNKTYSQENRKHFLNNLEQKRLNHHYMTLNEEHRKANAEQKELNEKYRIENEKHEQLNRWLEEECTKFSNQNILLKNSVEKLESQNNRYSDLNLQHQNLLNTFDTQTRKLKSQIENTLQKGENQIMNTLQKGEKQIMNTLQKGENQIMNTLQKGEKVSELALKEILNSLNTLEEQKKVLHTMHTSLEKKDTESLRLLSTLSEEVKKMGLDHLKTLREANEELIRNKMELEHVKSKLEKLLPIVERIDSATEKNLISASQIYDLLNRSPGKQPHLVN